MPITPYTGTFGKPELAHLLRRTMLGLTKPALTHFAGMTMNQVVNELLTVPTPASPPLNYVASTVDPQVPYGQTWTTVLGGGAHDSNRRNSLRGWWIGQMLNQGYSIHEKMAIFWHNHVPIEYQSDRPNYLYWYVKLIRDHALGNFKTFIREVTLTPAMLNYLNGVDNTRTAPNENFARELQELFTIGKDLPSYFTEADIQAAAKVLTGWRNNNTTETVYFTLSRHDITDKVFSSFYNNTVIVGQNTATGGTDELNALLDMIFTHQEVAKFVVRKLYRFFVYYNIDATVESDVIVPLAETYRNNNYEIIPVLQELFTSQHFYDTLQKSSHIRNPADFVIGTLRAFNMVFPTDVTALYTSWRTINTYMGYQQMEMGNPPNVAGWTPYYQAPGFHEIWINADSLRRKREFIDRCFGSTFSGVSIDMMAFTATMDNPSDPDLLIEEVLELFHPLPSEPALKNSLKSILLSGQTTNSYWTTAWNNYVSAPTNVTFISVVKSRLKTFYTAVLTMAEAYLS